MLHQGSIQDFLIAQARKKEQKIHVIVGSEIDLELSEHHSKNDENLDLERGATGNKDVMLEQFYPRETFKMLKNLGVTQMSGFCDEILVNARNDNLLC